MSKGIKAYPLDKFELILFSDTSSAIAQFSFQDWMYHGNSSRKAFIENSDNSVYC